MRFWMMQGAFEEDAGPGSIEEAGTLALGRQVRASVAYFF